MGNFGSKQIITIIGTGNITIYVNNKSIVLNEISNGITHDSELMNAYYEGTSINNKMIGDFPKFDVGKNIID